MSWIRECTLAVPSVQLLTAGDALYAVQLTNASGARFVTHRSFAQFRALRKTMRKCAAAADARHQLLDRFQRRHRPLPASSSHCTCGNEAGDSDFVVATNKLSACTFGAIQRVIDAAPFPSRIESLRAGLGRGRRERHARLNRRREALQQFLAALHNFLRGFPATVLRDRLTSARCHVLAAYAAFLGADEHFPMQSVAALHQPLMLQGWRQLCANQMMRQGDDEPLVEEDEDGTSILRLAPPSLNSTSRPSITRASTSGKLSDLDQDDNVVSTLPVLQVRPLKVQTMHSFMEEFRDGVLSQYAADITELQSPDLSARRKWEICLYVACRIGHTYAVQLILFNYADANATMADGSSCLHIAARMGREEIVSLLLEEGADVNHANDAGVTPLIAACRNGSVSIVQTLLDAGADLTACSSRGTYPLHAAIVSQNLEIVELLVARGANVNVMTASGITPLHFAAKLGSVAISEFLLRNHADPEKRTKNDSDALMIAEANGHALVCELLQRLSGVHSTAGERDQEVSSSFLLKSASPASKSPEMVRLCSHRLTMRPSALSVC